VPPEWQIVQFVEKLFSQCSKSVLKILIFSIQKALPRPKLTRERKNAQLKNLKTALNRELNKNGLQRKLSKSKSKRTMFKKNLFPSSKTKNKKQT
jgi:hypothetical protein